MCVRVVFLLVLVSLDVVCFLAHACVRLNKCCVHIPVRAERVFVLGQRCSLQEELD